jgi:iron(III) transport system permease protein
VHQALYNSAVLAIFTCIICIVIGTVCAYAKVRYQNRAAMVLESAASLTYAIPGIVIALSMIFHWGKIPHVYGTVSILILAYSTRYLILQIKNSTTAILSIHPSLEEAGKIAGSSQLRIWRTIVIPLLRRPILTGSFLIFISALTELSLSSLLASAGTKTIGLFIFNLEQGGDYNLSSAMSVCVVIIVLLVYSAVEYFNRQKA